jgi:tripartite-type tricarboxylate transporter receptor subunit TctC
MRKAAAGLLLPLASATATIGAAQAADAGQYPEKAIRVIVPFPAGSGTDSSARFIGERITALTGKPVRAAQDLADAVARLKPGDHVRLTVVRGGATRSVSLALGSSPQGT